MVSGGIMVYLSIQNSSNFRELTDKRILEETQELHNTYCITFQEVLNELNYDLIEFISEDSITLGRSITTIKNELVSDYMIMKENGVLIWPRFSIPQFSPYLQDSSSEFLRIFKQGQQHEFAENNLEISEERYKKALSRANSRLDSARVYNALARLQVKLNRPNSAFDYLQIVITDFGSAKNNFGIPYSYFSIDQLLKLEGTAIEHRKKEIFNTFLSQLNSGTIPFTPNSQSLLENLKSYSNSETEQSLNNSFSTNFKKAKNTFEIIRTYKPVLDNIVNGTVTASLVDLKGSSVFVGQNFQENILIVSNYNDNIYGFVVSLGLIDQKTRSNLPAYNHRFDYSIEVAKREVASLDLKSKHVFKNSFSLFFPDNIVIVKIKNENQVSEFIFNRILITIIGLVLLLAAMIIGFFMLVQDVARKKNIEKMKADFVANVTHELKTPLTSINMFADSIVMDRVQKEKDLKKYATIIVKESEKLKRMINNILDFSRKESDKLNIQTSLTSISTLIHEIMDEMNYWLEIHGFEVIQNLDHSLKANIDKEGLKQVLSNLLTNAIKYSPDKKQVEVRSYATDSKICIAVSDQGIGIPEENVSKIFDKFYRVSDSDNQGISGTGLGLTVSKDIVEAHGGVISVKSKMNKGTTFTIELNK